MNRSRAPEPSKRTTAPLAHMPSARASTPARRVPLSAPKVKARPAVFPLAASAIKPVPDSGAPA